MDFLLQLSEPPPSVFLFCLHGCQGSALVVLHICHGGKLLQGAFQLFPHFFFHAVHAFVHGLGDLQLQGYVVEGELPLDDLPDGVEAESFSRISGPSLFSSPPHISASMGVVMVLTHGRVAKSKVR